MKTVAIIQVRMNSTRLPGKALLPLAGKPCLWWTITRACLANEIDEVIIATTADSSNDPIQEFFDDNWEYFSKPVKLYRYYGKENDVIGRVYKAAKSNGVDIITEITNDCPMISPQHIDFLVRYLKREFRYSDYVSNCSKRSWPDGLDLQIYNKENLRRLITLFHPKQHCGWNFTQHSDTFKIHHFLAPYKYHLPHWRLTLDTSEDYILLDILFDKFGQDIGFKPETIIDYLKENPELLKINSNIRTKTPEEG